MSDIAKLAIVPIDRTGRPQSEVVAFLEELLARAATGEVQSIAVAYATADGSANTDACHSERPSDRFVVGSAILLLQHDFVCEMEQGRRPVESPTPTPAG